MYMMYVPLFQKKIWNAILLFSLRLWTRYWQKIKVLDLNISSFSIFDDVEVTQETLEK